MAKNKGTAKVGRICEQNVPHLAMASCPGKRQAVL